MDGIRKNHTIVTPCMVKILLYVAGSTNQETGETSSARITPAKAPPMKNINVTEIMYRIPMRLWSVVSSHDLSELATFRYVGRLSNANALMIAP